MEKHGRGFVWVGLKNGKGPALGTRDWVRREGGTEGGTSSPNWKTNAFHAGIGVGGRKLGQKLKSGGQGDRGGWGAEKWKLHSRGVVQPEKCRLQVAKGCPEGAEKLQDKKTFRDDWEQACTGGVNTGGESKTADRENGFEEPQSAVAGGH